MTDPPVRQRVRPVAVVVHVEAVTDDGVDLRPITTRPVRVPACEWSDWHLDVALAQIDAEVNP